MVNLQGKFFFGNPLLNSLMLLAAKKLEKKLAKASDDPKTKQEK